MITTLLLWAACKAPIDAGLPDGPRVSPGMPEFTRLRLASGAGDVPHGLPPRGPEPVSSHLADLEPAPDSRSAFDVDDNLLSSLGGVLEGTSGGGGEELQAVLDGMTGRRAANGIGALTLNQLFGDTFHPGLCENGEILTTIDDGDRGLDASFQLATFMQFVSDPAPSNTPMPGDCKAGVEANAGDVDAAEADGSCTEQEVYEFFREGEDCRACVGETAGDVTACVDEGRCYARAPVASWIDNADGTESWYRMAKADIWACAPDWSAVAVILADLGPDGSMPEPFDHPAWGYLCIPYWDEASETSTYTCFPGEDAIVGDTVGVGFFGRVQWMRTAGDESAPIQHRNRVAYASQAIVDGLTIHYFWGFTPTGLGVISKPSGIPDTNGDGVTDLGDENFGFGLDGWGINPLALRPDGADPTVLDDTLARDWLAAAALKFSTTRDGVPIQLSNHNRCADGAWEGPYDDGSWRCTTMSAPDGNWLDDANNTWFDSSFTRAYPMFLTTIGSTGLPDPDVPGGVVPEVAGSPTLANPAFDDCTWPDEFTADLVPYEDTPAAFGGRASLWGDSYRFGKDPDLDLRAVLSTVEPRGFCPEAG